MKVLLKKFIIGFGLLRSIRWLQRKLRGPGITVIYGHRVISDEDFANPANHSRIAGHTCVSDLSNAIALLLEHGYKIISIDEAVQQFAKGEIKQDSVVLTFDDGFEDNLTNLLPILKKYDVPATCYINSSVIGTNKSLWFQSILNYFFSLDSKRVFVKLNSKEYDISTPKRTFRSAFRFTRYLQAEYPPEEFNRLIEEETNKKCLPSDKDKHLSWDDLETLKNEPLITLGAHSFNHYPLAMCDNSLAEFEILESIRQLENKLDIKIDHFSYPRGHVEDFNDFHKQVLSSAGISSAVSTIRGVNRLNVDMYSIKRVGLPANTLEDKYDFMWHVAGAPQLLSKLKNKVRAKF
ncbi:polysaccharide deacetylase family protein [Aliikangiella coralliicola]|uniref:polysaccharide deacetylase family protein n=1 Tax=Aliikangiella coralliicola TaxID=2592383 RepID=UPI00143D63D0|nr:polysaccharide deacetylase family protein [Aliikangiella coralliicola]